MLHTSNLTILKTVLLVGLITAGSACSTGPSSAPPPASKSKAPISAAKSDNLKKGQDTVTTTKEQPKAALAAKPTCPATADPGTGVAATAARSVAQQSAALTDPASDEAQQSAALDDPTSVTALALDSGTGASTGSAGQVDANGCPILAAVAPAPATILPQPTAPSAADPGSTGGAGGLLGGAGGLLGGAGGLLGGGAGGLLGGGVGGLLGGGAGGLLGPVTGLLGSAGGLLGGVPIIGGLLGGAGQAPAPAN